MHCNQCVIYYSLGYDECSACYPELAEAHPITAHILLADVAEQIVDPPHASMRGIPDATSQWLSIPPAGARV
jgi:hypothetical protein